VRSEGFLCEAELAPAQKLGEVVDYNTLGNLKKNKKLLRR
jgi:hypothetical protein